MATDDNDQAKETAARDPTVEGLVTDRVGVEKPTTFSGWADPNDRFCELCTYASSARFLAPDYQDGTAVCTTHARALVNGNWVSDKKFEVTPLEFLEDRS